jgi:predicted nucleotidyltransferase
LEARFLLSTITDQGNPHTHTHTHRILFNIQLTYTHKIDTPRSSHHILSLAKQHLDRADQGKSLSPVQSMYLTPQRLAFTQSQDRKLDMYVEEVLYLNCMVHHQLGLKSQRNQLARRLRHHLTSTPTL